MKYRVQNPATGETIEEFDYATDAEITETLERAENAFQQWSQTSFAQRAEVLNKAGDIIEERMTELAENASEEMGKPTEQAMGELKLCVRILRYYAENGEKLAADEEIDTYNGRAIIRRLPLGVLLGIMPWNFPYYQVIRFVAPNLMLGNTIILKHSEITPRSALLLAEIFTEAGLPDGAYNNVFATHDQISTIIADPRVQGVSLTGSERAGSAVAAQAGKHLKKCVLELGGNDPYIVLDADDVARAAKLAWRVRLSNTGQACNSNKRIIVLEELYDAFVAALVEHAQAMEPGDPSETGKDKYSPLSSIGAADQLADQVERAVADGATLLAGGKRGEHAYYEPTVLVDVDRENTAFREELFGPVAVVYKVADEEEAVELANDSDYGLGGAVFSADVDRADRVARRLHTGMVGINEPSVGDAELPFGGVKRSGFGRELGPLGMEEFVNKQLYYVREG